MTAEPKSAQEWGADFSSVRGHHNDFTEALSRLVAQLLSTAGIEVAQREARTKTVESFTEKIERKKKYLDPIEEVTDLVGLRVILYYQDDVDAVGRLIESEFDVDKEISPRQGSDLAVDRFGYRSDHYVLKLTRRRLELPEYQRFSDCRAEIQVRTVMDHAWAAVDHKIRYKSSDLPDGLQRRLFRLKALLEVADEQFAALRDASSKVVSSYEKSVSSGNLDVVLDALSLRAYMDQTEVGEQWAKRSEQAGFGTVSSGRLDQQAAWTEELLRYLLKGGLTRLSDFKELLQSAETWGDDAFQTIGGVAMRLHPVITQPPELALLILVQCALKDEQAIDEAAWLPGVRAGMREALAIASYRPRDAS